MSGRRWALLASILLVLAAAAAAVSAQLPLIGAHALLHPARRPVTSVLPAGCVTRTFAAGDATLMGWLCEARGERRGTLVYLHGIADNRDSSVGIIRRFVLRGFFVVAYDSRAHGDSTGDACAYGYFERDDLHRILDTVAGPVVLIGNSLGAAVALQEAARDPRVTAVVAIAPFSDLRTIATERAPIVFTAGILDRAFARAETEAHFRVDAVSPVAAARSIAAPVLLVHDAADVDTPPAHSERILSALAGPKRLLLVSGVGHNDALPAVTWDEIERWIADRMVQAPRATRPASS